MTRTTNGTGANSGTASKVWVNARISIAPNATNEIGQPHTFTVTLEKDSGSGFGPAAGEHVDVTLTTVERGNAPDRGHRHLHQRRGEHQRERPVHDHVRLADRPAR